MYESHAPHVGSELINFIELAPIGHAGNQRPAGVG
jgi:hypothetical protein